MKPRVKWNLNLMKLDISIWQNPLTWRTIFSALLIVKYVENNPDVINPHYGGYILSVHWPFALSWSNCMIWSTSVQSRIHKFEIAWNDNRFFISWSWSAIAIHLEKTPAAYSYVICMYLCKTFWKPCIKNATRYIILLAVILQRWLPHQLLLKCELLSFSFVHKYLLAKKWKCQNTACSLSSWTWMPVVKSVYDFTSQ